MRLWYILLSRLLMRVQSAEDMEGISAVAAERARKAVAPPQPPGGPYPTLSERGMLLQELPLETRFVGVSPYVWAATTHAPGAHFNVAASAKARLGLQVRATLQRICARGVQDRPHRCDPLFGYPRPRGSNTNVLSPTCKLQVQSLGAARFAQIDMIGATAAAKFAASQAAADPAAAAALETGAGGPATQRLAGAHTALHFTADALLTALRGGKPLALPAAAASASAATPRGPTSSATRPLLVGAPRAAALGAAGTADAPLRNYKRRREGYGELEVGAAPVQAAAAGPSGAPPPKRERPSADPGPGDALARSASVPQEGMLPPGSSSGLPPSASAASTGSSAVGAAAPFTFTAPTPYEGGGAMPGGLGSLAGLMGTHSSEGGLGSLAGLMGTHSSEGSLGSLAGLMGAHGAPPEGSLGSLAGLLTPSLDAAAAPPAAAAPQATQSAADATRLIAAVLAEHAALLSDADKATIAAFSSHVTGGGEAMAGADGAVCMHSCA